MSLTSFLLCLWVIGAFIVYHWLRIRIQRRRSHAALADLADIETRSREVDNLREEQRQRHQRSDELADRMTGVESQMTEINDAVSATVDALRDRAAGEPSGPEGCPTGEVGEPGPVGVPAAEEARPHHLDSDAEDWSFEHGDSSSGTDSPGAAAGGSGYDRPMGASGYGPSGYGPTGMTGMDPSQLRSNIPRHWSGNTANFARGHETHGMRLPSSTKAAFTSTVLFAQQQNMQTHDFGLQCVLQALHTAVMRLHDEPVSLGEFDFTMNFAQAASVTDKRYSVRMRYPISDQLVLVQSMDPGTMLIRWLVVHNGAELFFDPEPHGEISIRDSKLPVEREHRVIQLDDIEVEK